MREIKFRGKHITTGEWLYGSHYDDCGEEYVLPNMHGSAVDYEDYQVDPNTVGQYTGLKDKNGKEIYEGDIMKCKYDDEYYPYKVKYTSRDNHWAHFTLVDSDGDYEKLSDPDEMEVIGNIHDNPELLKEDCLCRKICLSTAASDWSRP